MTGTSQPVSELQKTDAIISPYVTQGIFLFRAPYGAWNATVAQKLNAAGYERYVGSVFWDVGGDLTTQYAADWACWSHGISVGECANRYMNEIRDRRRGIVLMHDVHSKTIDMVKVMVPKLEAEGFKFARLDAVPNIAARIVQAGGTPGPGPMTLGKIECPDSYHIENVGTAGGKYCTNGTDVWGPFTKAMVAKCLQWGGGDACHTDRWATSLAVAARGTGACPLGAAWDSTTTYCVEDQDAFGPFPKPLVEKCIQWGGGDKACRSARWNRGFLAALQGH
ncbi:MAG: hypothetical protein HY898_05005 [Deltaproteobacteria bacterium]|nr:hypothetical protein [Deltaproteobacteria bacterium]